jgi:hypothetical protein
MAIKYTNIFNSKALQNIPKLGFLVRKNEPSGSPVPLSLCGARTAIFVSGDPKKVILKLVYFSDICFAHISDGKLSRSLATKHWFHEQGDQIERILAQCAIAYFGQFYEDYIQK